MSKMSERINVRAITGACTAFFLLHALLSYVFSKLVFGAGDNLETIILLVNIATYSIYIACGYMVALLAKCNGTIHGIITGALSKSIFYLYVFMLAEPVSAKEIFSEWHIGLFVSVLFCGLGGLTWDLQSKLSNKTPNKSLNPDAQNTRAG